MFLKEQNFLGAFKNYFRKRFKCHFAGFAGVHASPAQFAGERRESRRDRSASVAVLARGVSPDRLPQHRPSAPGLPHRSRQRRPTQGLHQTSAVLRHRLAGLLQTAEGVAYTQVVGRENRRGIEQTIQ